MDGKRDVKKFIALGLIIFLGAFLFYALRSYVTAFFGAFILFVLFNPLYLRLTTTFRMRKRMAALVIILITIVLIILPISFLVSTAITEMKSFADYKGSVVDNINSLDKLLPELEIKTHVKDQLSQLMTSLKDLLLGIVQGISHLLISLTIMYFLFYYLLLNHEQIDERALIILPFNKKNASAILREFKEVTHSTLVTTGLLAILQGTLLLIGFLIFGIDRAVFWSFVGILASFIPFVGIALVWVPTVLILLLQHNYVAGIGILIWGIMLSSVDNFVRPYIQCKVNKSIHPLVTLIGIFVGVPFFGLVGIFIGPLLVLYFILMIKMFKEEYLR